VERAIPALERPLIVTARHPAEGGVHALSTAGRRDLLARFLPFAKYVDVELRSAESFHSLLRVGGNRKVKRILSFHDFDSTPTRGSLHAKARRAAALGADIFKVAVRTDNNAQLARLLEFSVAARSIISLSAMGMGALGAISRVLLAQCGSVLTYAALSSRKIDGQMTVEELQLALRLFQARGK
jgi:3-dehydroquinate dehydratase-1